MRHVHVYLKYTNSHAYWKVTYTATSEIRFVRIMTDWSINSSYACKAFCVQLVHTYPINCWPSPLPKSIVGAQPTKQTKWRRAHGTITRPSLPTNIRDWVLDGSATCSIARGRNATPLNLKRNKKPFFYSCTSPNSRVIIQSLIIGQ